MVNLAIINYEMGNQKSISSGLKKAGAIVQITKDPKVIINSDGIVVPGVGAFGKAMKNLKPLKKFLVEQINAGKPFLGICLGLQILFEKSEEHGSHKGLEIFAGKVVKLPETVVIPHMGWNTLIIRDFDNPLLEGINNESYVYFVHSYSPVPCNREIIATKTQYGVSFTSMVHKDNIFATQFHPEKSSTVGLKILKNFINFIKK